MRYFSLGNFPAPATGFCGTSATAASFREGMGGETLCAVFQRDAVPGDTPPTAAIPARQRPEQWLSVLISNCFCAPGAWSRLWSDKPPLAAEAVKMTISTAKPAKIKLLRG